MTGAVRDVLSSVKERRRQTAIGATVEVDHIVDILTRVAMDKKPGPGGTALLALLGIAREPPAPGRVADGKVEPVAEPNAEGPIRPAFGPIVARARPLRLRLAVSARAFKDQIEPIGADRHLPGGRMRNGICPPGNC